MDAWAIRTEFQKFEFDMAYNLHPELFSIKIHHGGEFSINNYHKVYERGKVNYVDLLDIERFGIFYLSDIIKKFGYQEESHLYYHFLIPGSNLEFGLRALKDDNDVSALVKFVPENCCISVYIEHEKSHLEQAHAIETLFPDWQDLQDDFWVNENDQEYRVGNEEDGEIIVDEDNEIEEVEVDMNDFKANIYDQNYKGNEGVVDGYSSLEEDNMSDDSFGTSSEEEEIETMRKKAFRKLRKKHESSKEKCAFYVGQEFGNNKDVKSLIKRHAVETRREIGFYRNDKVTVRSVCRGKIPHIEDAPNQIRSQEPIQDGQSKKVGPSKKCASSKKDGGRQTVENPYKSPWVLHVSKLTWEQTWTVKTYNSEHKCIQSRSVRAFTSSWLSKEIIPQVESDTNISIKNVQQQAQQRYEMGLSRMKAFRAKTKAEAHVLGDLRKQYHLLSDYILELKRTNIGTTVKLDVETEPNLASPVTIFKRICICLGPLKEGFKACKREILGLDGTFMKGPFPGQLLTAVGMDANYGIYPVAYGIVEAENFKSWEWFLDNLGDDLDLHRNSNFTFISDRQKGIIPAITKLYPCAEHRYCLRHIHQNMKLQWRGKAYKDMLYSIAMATTSQEYQSKMQELKYMNVAAYQWLNNIPPAHWTRSHFTGRAKSDVLLNNMCEVFNSKLVDGRDKPIITALEFVREYLMKRIVNVTQVISKCHGILTPAISKKLEVIKKEASKLTVKWNGGSKFQVAGYMGEQFVVDVDARTSTCRRWDLTGIPCKHAVASNWDMSLNGLEVEIPEKWVDACYRLNTWKTIYSYKVEPINGKSMWPISTCPTNLKEPKHHKPIGRPKKKRKKDATEKEDEMIKGGKLSKKLKTTTCGTCGNRGHNRRSCKGQEEVSSSTAK